MLGDTATQGHACNTKFVNSDLTEHLRVLEYFTSKWDGPPLDERGFIRILNEGGTKKPLLWCFNAEHEFAVLGKALGPDQPLIGMRSLNVVVRVGPRRILLEQALASHYGDLILAHLRGRPCVFGANCQSVSIMTHIVRRYCEVGRSCELFVALEAVPALPIPGPCALLFGDQSQDHNPLLNGDGRDSVWDLCFAGHSVDLVPGAHGTFFEQANVSGLAETVSRRLAEAARFPAIPETPFKGLACRLTGLSEHPDRPGVYRATGTLHANPGTPHPGGLALCHSWREKTFGAVLKPQWVPIHARAPSGLEFDVGAPKLAGRWELLTYLAVPRSGPIQWRSDELPSGLEVIVEGGDEAEDATKHPTGKSHTLSEGA